jgi:competence protein ComEA
MRAEMGASSVLLAGALLCSLGWSAAATAQSDESRLPDGDGRDIVARACSQCHGLENVTEDRRTRGDWQDVVDEMAGLGAQVDDAQIKKVIDYLTRYLGRVNVNRDPQQDLQDVLEITSDEAAAIVTYRTREGDFHVLEDLKKVPGLDFSKIDAKKDRVAFTG